MSRFDWDPVKAIVVIASTSGPRPRIVSARRATKPNAMTTSDDVDDLDIPEIDLCGPRLPNRFARKPGEKHEIRIDGAIGYSLRLIPSNKILACFQTTLEAWPAIIAAVESNRSPRTLALDWNGADGRRGMISAGPSLERWARRNNGEAIPYAVARRKTSARRVAES